MSFVVKVENRAHAYTHSEIANRDVACLLDDVFEGQRSATDALATLHAFVTCVKEQLAHQCLQLLLSDRGRRLRMLSVVKNFHLINHANYLTTRAKESHDLGCDLVRTGQRRLKCLCVEDGLFEETGAVQRLIAKILECHRMIEAEPIDNPTIKIHYLITNDLCYLFQAVNETVRRLLAAFDDYTLPQRYAQRGYNIYLTFTEQCAPVVGLLQRTQSIFAKDRNFDYSHPATDMEKSIRRRLREMRGPPRVIVDVGGYKRSPTPLFGILEVD